MSPSVYTVSVQDIVDDSQNGDQQEDTPLLSQPQATAIPASGVLWRLCIISILLASCVTMLETPLAQIFENIICEQYYAHGQINADHGVNLLCKVEPVQSELAFLRGWLFAVVQIPSIFLVLPFGIIIDRVGRKPVFILYILGCLLSDLWMKTVCTWLHSNPDRSSWTACRIGILTVIGLFPDFLPLRLVWLCPVFESIGGGGQIIYAILYTIVADVCSEQERSSALLRVFAAGFVAPVIAPPLVAILMERSPWIPAVISSVLLLLAGIVVLTLPETHPSLRIDAKMREVASEADDHHEQTLSTTLRDSVRHFGESFRPLIRNGPAAIMLMVLLILATGPQLNSLMLQYASKRCGWAFSRANLLNAVQAIVVLTVTLVLIPSASSFMTKRLGFSATRTDLILTQLSVAIIIVGACVIAFAPGSAMLICGWVILALGSAAIITVQSCLSTLVPPASVGFLFSACSVASAIGCFIAGPLMATAFRRGLYLGGVWLGLPFMLAAVVHAFALGTVSLVGYMRQEQSVREGVAEEAVHSEINVVPPSLTVVL